MKTKLLKFGMPLMAFLLAIVFVFANNEKPAPVDTLVDGYILSNGCSTPVTHGCVEDAQFICKVNQETVFRSGCVTPLMSWN
jgi:uncharacterized protein DUF6520